jgi:hypothetical protein
MMNIVIAKLLIALCCYFQNDASFYPRQTNRRILLLL